MIGGPYGGSRFFNSSLRLPDTELTINERVPKVGVVVQPRDEAKLTHNPLLLVRYLLGEFDKADTLKGGRRPGLGLYGRAHLIEQPGRC